ncbi:hypothetical protein A1OE_902 [Candidatus Endolissoclinum faulkneri L2]|uniref:Uncharacterized protein n=1 Tax=Candidatus Endolissoclinum faulkneri L2 TaxID=1193729 RepID=K7ZD15_9PROT|nr:hypothetical protein A1OE_902 [Candidatus Endolissoclinum faulkneri L2]
MALFNLLSTLVHLNLPNHTLKLISALFTYAVKVYLVY